MVVSLLCYELMTFSSLTIFITYLFPAQNDAIGVDTPVHVLYILRPLGDFKSNLNNIFPILQIL